MIRRVLIFRGLVLAKSPKVSSRDRDFYLSVGFDWDMPFLSPCLFDRLCDQVHINKRNDNKYDQKLS